MTFKIEQNKKQWAVGSGSVINCEVYIRMLGGSIPQDMNHLIK